MKNKSEMFIQVGEIYSSTLMH